MCRGILTALTFPAAFVVGISANALARFRSYYLDGFGAMHVVFQSDDPTAVEYTEAVLIRLLESCEMTANNKWLRIRNELRDGDGRMRNNPGRYTCYLVIGNAMTMDAEARRRQSERLPPYAELEDSD